jgi:putative endonuclease
MSTDPRHRLGHLGEDLAVQHLERLGHTVVARNHRTRFGELDVVSVCGDTLVFVEVKTRRGTGRPWDALHDRKQRQVRAMARAFLAEVAERPRTRSVRFDAIGITVDGRDRLAALEHLEAAF